MVFDATSKYGISCFPNCSFSWLPRWPAVSRVLSLQMSLRKRISTIPVLYHTYPFFLSPYSRWLLILPVLCVPRHSRFLFLGGGGGGGMG